MLEINGIKNGAVLQRDENDFCKAILFANFKGEPKTTLGKLTLIEKNKWELSGIFVGGPYNFAIEDKEEKIEFSDIYVGDLWLLAGQSNMEGAGKLRESQKNYDKNPVETVRAYYMNEKWDAARTQLHQLWESADEYIYNRYRSQRKDSRWGDEFPKVQDNGVGPGLYFALEMQNLCNGIPQGVIPCGIGGASLEEWNPKYDDKLYAAAKRRFHECGGHIKGIFWHQGETQAMGNATDTFVSEMKTLVDCMRKDFGENLPFVQVQLNKYMGASKENDAAWNKIRELQRTLDQHINNLVTVYSVDCELDDLIHLSSESQEIIGKRAAEAMMLLSERKGVPSPEFKSIEIVQDDYVPFFYNIRVNYKNIVGKLTSNGVPWGFYILDSESSEPFRAISRVCLEGDSVRIKVELDKEKLEESYICYAYGNTFYCNITDSGNRSLPAFGPLKISDYLNKGE